MNYLLSVSAYAEQANAEHPNFANPPKGEFEARDGSGPLLTNGAEGLAFEARRQLRAAPHQCC